MSNQNREVTIPMLGRLVIMHNLIKSGKYPNCNELAKMLKVGTATINRDRDFLRDTYRAPLEYNAAKRGYYYTKPFELPFHSLSTSDMQVLASAKVLLSHFEDSPIYENLNSIIDLLAPNNKNDFSMIKRISVLPVPKTFYEKTIWSQIYEAMRTNQIIEFDYKGLGKEETTHRRVRPYQLVMDDGLVYLLGYSEEREAERIFSLSRMSNMIITEDQFELPDNYDYSERSKGGRFGVYIQDHKTEFKIRFYDSTKQAVQERKWADDQQFDVHEDYVDLTFTSNQDPKILQWVLSLGYTATPLAPEWFVEKWKDSLFKMAKLAGLQ